MVNAILNTGLIIGLVIELVTTEIERGNSKMIENSDWIYIYKRVNGAMPKLMNEHATN